MPQEVFSRAILSNLTPIVVQQPIRAAQFVLHPDGTLRYVPLTGCFGDDVFKFKVKHGYLDSPTFEVTIKVSDLHHPHRKDGFNDAEVQVPGLPGDQAGIELDDPEPHS